MLYSCPVCIALNTTESVSKESPNSSTPPRCRIVRPDPIRRGTISHHNTQDCKTIRIAQLTVVARAQTLNCALSPSTIDCSFQSLFAHSSLENKIEIRQDPIQHVSARKFRADVGLIVASSHLLDSQLAIRHSPLQPQWGVKMTYLPLLVSQATPLAADESVSRSRPNFYPRSPAIAFAPKPMLPPRMSAKNSLSPLLKPRFFWVSTFTVND